MIKVVYHRDINRVTMEGHAQSGEAGHDLVCAAASVLCSTLAVNVDALADAGQIRKPTIKLESGAAEIWCKPIRKYNSVVEVIFKSICVGFELLAINNPDYISYEIRG